MAKVILKLLGDDIYEVNFSDNTISAQSLISKAMCKIGIISKYRLISFHILQNYFDFVIVYKSDELYYKSFDGKDWKYMIPED